MSWASARPGDQPPAVAVAGALGDHVYVTHDTSGEPFPPPSAGLLDYLRRIANHDDVPDTVQADARDYLRHREAASAGSISVTAEPRVTVADTATSRPCASSLRCRGLGAGLPEPRTGHGQPPVAVTSRGRHSSRDAWSLASCPSRGCSRRTRRRSRTLFEVGQPPDGESPVAPGGGKDSSTSTVGGRCGSGSSSSIGDAWSASSARCRALVGLPRAAGESSTAARRSASPSPPVVVPKRLCIGIQAPIHAVM